MRALDTIKSTKFEAGILYLNVYTFFFLEKTPFALVIKNNKIQQFATHAKLET